MGVVGRWELRSPPPLELENDFLSLPLLRCLHLSAAVLSAARSLIQRDRHSNYTLAFYRLSVYKPA